MMRVGISEGRRLNGFTGLSLNDRTILFLVISMPRPHPEIFTLYDGLTLCGKLTGHE